MLPVILCGGSGSRLWPQSRSLYPKQFLPLVNDQSMLQNTVARLQGIAGASAPLVIANEEHRFLVAEQLRQVNIQPSGILLEPVRKTRVTEKPEKPGSGLLFRKKQARRLLTRLNSHERSDSRHE